MNLREIYHKRKSARGFTFIELMLVIALVAILGVFIVPVGLSFYQSQLLGETSDGLVSALRHAQRFALTSTHDNAFGVFITADTYTIFEGSAYASRIVSEDVVFSIASTVTVSGLQEIVFSEMSGTPSAIGSVIISSGNKVSQIDVLASGNIER